MKIGTLVTPKPVMTKNAKTDKVQPYYLDILDPNLVYKITAITEGTFGMLVKTDRVEKWVNAGWFQECR